jgi:uncharacterized protein (TIGR03905 family)
MFLKFKTSGTCAREIKAEIEGGKIKNLSFAAGCSGNLKGIARLVEGMDLEQVIAKLEGIICQNGTSCPDQLAKALKEYLARKNKMAI